MKHVLVIANETVAGKSLIDSLKQRVPDEGLRVTVVCPINEPREGYVVYEDTRRASAGRRLDRTLTLLREAGIPASGLVVDADPVNATRDAIAQAEPPIDAVVVSTHPKERSGWLQRNVVERIRKACAEGRQAYWVCTLIDDSDEVVAQAAQSTYEDLCKRLPEVRVGLVHGRMKAAEKQATMRAFKDGEIGLLVATTVIEVGVDVPNASLMIIENAERLGLAQLHQLRGRVGRGSAASSCVLLYQAPLSQMARQRLETMRETNDGFVIAEKDLELRGPGELLGTRQTGLAQFRVADLARDADLLPQVHEMGEKLLRESPELAERIVARWVGGAVRFASA